MTHYLSRKTRQPPKSVAESKSRQIGHGNGLDTFVEPVSETLPETPLRLLLAGLLANGVIPLVIDDRWLHEQLSSIAEAFSKPLSLRAIDAVGQQLREVIEEQSRLKRELTEAQSRLKAMLAGFIDRLSEITGTTGEYHELLDRCVRRIEEASNIADLSEVVSELMLGTQQVKESALRTGQELNELRDQVGRANREIVHLQRELETASHLVSHDSLTGVLNRRGLIEALTRETSRTRRNGSPLCIALIDVDNFKGVNDQYGHGTGDEALRHLTCTATETLRPQDVIARYGGEEFVILLPDTVLNAASSILKRLQRELACRVFYAHDCEILPITFSAGIVLFSPEEDLETALSRADAAMYAAKGMGKNRVCTQA